MKKIFLLLVLIFCVFTAPFSYAQNKLTTIVTEKWQNNAWVNSEKESFAYDSVGLLKIKNTEQWKVQTGWSPLYKYTHTYDTLNRLAENLQQRWDSQLSIWKDYYNVYFYYYGNSMYEMKCMAMASSSNTWELYRTVRYFYDTNNRLKQCSRYAGAGSWPDTYTIYDYNSLNLISDSTTYNSIGSVSCLGGIKGSATGPIKHWKVEYKYSSNAKVRKVDFLLAPTSVYVPASPWNPEYWQCQLGVYQNSKIYDYNNEGQLVRERKLTDTLSSAASPEEFTYSYYSNGLLYQSVEKATGINKLRKTYYYDNATSVKPSQAFSFSLSPNPSSEAIKVVLAEDAATKAVITDLHGREVGTQTFDGNEANISVKHLSSGLYLLRLERSNGVSVSKFVKE